MTVLVIALLALAVLLVAAGLLILDLRTALRGAESELQATVAKLRDETALKVDALIQLRDVRQRACSVCRAESAYLQRRVSIRRVA